MSNVVDAKQALFDLLVIDQDGTPVEDLTTVTRVYRGLQRFVMAPVSLMIWSTPGGTATDHTLTLVAMSSPDTDIILGQDALDQAVDDINALLADDGTFGRPSWSYDYDIGTDRFVAQWQFEVGRDDF